MKKVLWGLAVALAVAGCGEGSDSWDDDWDNDWDNYRFELEFNPNEICLEPGESTTLVAEISGGEGERVYADLVDYSPNDALDHFWVPEELDFRRAEAEVTVESDRDTPFGTYRFTYEAYIDDGFGISFDRDEATFIVDVGNCRW